MGSFKPLTAVGGEFSLAGDLREQVAFMPDGRLLISATHKFSPLVRGFVGRLKHLKRDFAITYVDLAAIKACYVETAQQNTFSNSEMQIAAKGLFARGAAVRASDIHLRLNSKGRMGVFFRIHNDLQFAEEHPYDWGHRLCSTIYQAMTDASDSSFEPLFRQQDARISAQNWLPSCLDGIRIATSPQVDGFIMTLRLFYNDNVESSSLIDLGFSHDHSDAILYMRKRPTGIIIIGGPTGSGKSTTLQRALSSIIKETKGSRHVLTVEDPPEYPIKGAVQTPVTNAETEEDRNKAFQRSIKAAMRLDPDIIMLSEVRDEPTARLSIQAAMTGHQVWTTVHANNALAILDRMRDLGVKNEILTDPSIVAGLICQRLIKLLCPKCKVPISERLDRYEGHDVRRVQSVLNMPTVFVQGDGCEHCRQLGVVGRTVIAETVVTDHGLFALVRAGDKIGAAEYVAREQAGSSMLNHAIEKINSGVADPFAVESVVGFLNAGVIEQDHCVSRHEIRGQGGRR